MKDTMTAVGRVTLTTSNATKKIRQFSKGGLKYAICLITPEVAKELLKLEKRNRDRTLGNVKIYSGYMTSAKWILNPQPIAFDINGNLIDGAHRLLAIIDANKSEEFVICCGCSLAVQMVMDQGNSRTVVDVMRVEPGTKRDGDKYRNKTTTKHSSILRSMIVESPHSLKVSIPKLEAVEFLKEYFDPIDEVLEMYGSKNGKGNKSVRNASVAAPIVRAYEIYKGDPIKVNLIRRFVGILTGEVINLQDNERAAKSLRDWLLEELNSKKVTRPKNRSIYRKTETALASYMKKESCEYLADAKVEYFPIKMTGKLVPYLDPTKNMTRKHGGQRLTRKTVSKKNNKIYVGV